MRELRSIVVGIRSFLTVLHSEKTIFIVKLHFFYNISVEIFGKILYYNLRVYCDK